MKKTIDTATLSLLFLAACVAPVESGRLEKDSEPPEEDSAPLSEDCQEDTALSQSARIEETLVSTVFRLYWTAPDTTPAVVVYSDGVLTHTLHITPKAAGEQEVLLLGLPADTTIQVQIQTDGTCGAELSFQTGALPADLPPAELVVSDVEQAHDGYVLVPIINEAHSYVTIIDSLGRYVWAYGSATQVTRARLSLDQTAILIHFQTYSADTLGSILRLGLDGTVQGAYQPIGSHTDFVELPDESIVALGWEVQEFEERKLLGDTLVRADLSGESTVLWSAFDSFRPELSYTYLSGWYVPDPSVEDWSHVNGLSYDDGDLFVSITNLQSLARIDGETGELIWAVGGMTMDETGATIPNTEQIHNPHSIVHVGGDELLSFNRHDYFNECSTVDQLGYDLQTNTLTTLWSYTSEDCLQVYYLGDARRLTNGHTMISWTTAGRIDEVTPEGERVWSVQMDLGAGVGFLEPFDSFGIE